MCINIKCIYYTVYNIVCLIVSPCSPSWLPDRPPPAARARCMGCRMGWEGGWGSPAPACPGWGRAALRAAPAPPWSPPASQSFEGGGDFRFPMSLFINYECDYLSLLSASVSNSNISSLSAPSILKYTFLFIFFSSLLTWYIREIKLN